MTRPLLSIQYLRAFAVMMVVVYHAMRWTTPTFEIGAAGVDVFFVISGFIMWAVSAERPPRPGRFLYARWARVAPLYWVLTLFVAGLALIWPWLIWDAAVDLRHLIYSLLFVQHINPDGEPFPIITVGWSLNYEAVFYLIFAASLFAPSRWRFYALAAGLLAIPTFGFFYRPAWFLGANLMFLQFLAGVLIAVLWRNDLLPERITGWVFVAAGLVIFAAIAPFNLFMSNYRPLFWGAPAVLIVVGLVTVETRKGLPRIPWLKKLGDASYSIYLGHAIAVQLLSFLIWSNRPVFIPVAIVVSMAAGFAVHYGLERPLLSLFRKRSHVALPSTNQ